MTKSTPLSNCCKAPVIVSHGCDDDFEHGGKKCDCEMVTTWNACTKCERPCDLFYELKPGEKVDLPGLEFTAVNDSKDTRYIHFSNLPKPKTVSDLMKEMEQLDEKSIYQDDNDEDACMDCGVSVILLKKNVRQFVIRLVQAALEEVLSVDSPADVFKVPVKFYDKRNKIIKSLEEYETK